MVFHVVQTNIYYFKYFKIFGFFPFALEKDSNFATSIENAAHLIIFQLLNVTIFGLTIFQIYKQFNTHSTVSLISVTLQEMSGTLTLFFIFFESYFLKQSHKNMIQELIKIDAILEKEINTSKVDMKRLIPKKAIIIGLTSLIILFFILIGVNMVEDGLTQLFIYQIIALAFVYTRMIQLMFYLVLIIERLVIFKRVLKFKSERTLDSDDLWNAKKFFTHLDELNECFNGTFGWSILIISIQNFIQMTTSGYETVMILAEFEQTRNLQGKFLCL